MNTDPRESLMEASRQFYQLGWMAGTAGNLSARVEDGSFWITASGKQKGKLVADDFVRVSLTGELLETPNPENKPSAETSIHQAIYSCFAEARACYHVHSVEAKLVTNFVEGEKLPLPPIEMLKGLGVWEENPQVFMPVFHNHLQVPKIAQEISDRFHRETPQVPALLIRNHGVTVWANSAAEAENHVELAEYIFRYIVAARQVGIKF
ncbi:methylthioribulose 1-phosphate dehydratase [Limnospira fusiformis KN01]|uniref:Methylthioribulose-1-phosphate dehydratase n=1 Tax=Limnospira fusiformis PMC 851.14 TaxID=2219512 RepID=A0ABU9EJE9_LIMFS|nr:MULTISPECIES: methylthioribulose 1-phosphate dehydratase [Limnospira]EKD10442.1 methylthioribulose-1-phosphate dehydratase [Arthrospira platensis C1]MDT9187010.1 methylthioribulose 1-phosphate dehydratase [Limnospira sp. PMC 894.15]MDT9197492.1 methylthioribulose 1-phosphate dehydratase [Limnospira sp. PMC 1042.18]MDT9233056.1 methylthioribulose 1-phosphate dehydratase [Limnospira sp. PMC 917.15]MDT9273835.1 methylthioribulose 1-phosphate dehydratase [Limnospira sp. PMC 737.11]